MRIVITMYTIKSIDEYLDELYDKYSCVILRRNRSERTLTLVTGDIINGYSASSRRDGIRADVAIGLDAKYLSCRSNMEKPVWEQEDLHKYLDSIVEVIEERR